MSDLSRDLTATLRAMGPTMRPVVANALWPRLRAGAWATVRRRIVSYSGDGGLRSTTPPTPPPDPRWERVREAECLYAYAPRALTRAGYGIRAILARPDHDAVLRELSRRHRDEYHLALEQATAERPFYRAPETPSGWRRNFNDPLITERCVFVLEQLAAVSDVALVPAEIEDALLT